MNNNDQHNSLLSPLNHRDPSTAQEISNLMKAAYQIEAQMIGAKDFPPLKRSFDSIQNANTKFYAWEINGQWVGVTEIATMAQGMIHIEGLVVSPEHFRNGYGSAMLAAIIKLYPSQEITVATAQNNYPAIKLYQQHGFEVFEQWYTKCGISMNGFSLVRQ